MTPLSASPSTANPFLALFPHRWDFLYAEHPEPGEQPDWRIESRFPLSDRLIQQGAHLYGVRFGTSTKYVLLTIDSESDHHPNRDSFSIDRILTALEPLGLVRPLICTSDANGGLQVYFPFKEALPSWEIALAVTTLLTQADFWVKPGQLEVLPNARPFVKSGKPLLFEGHRLPLQGCSYLLNGDLDPIFSSHERFIEQWSNSATQNNVDMTLLNRTLQSTRRFQYPLSAKANKFLNDLNAEIEPGWTGPGQTNYLLGRIAMRAYIFGHVLYADEPLTGQALIDNIVNTARGLPGYRDWCGHQANIVNRATDWARSVEDSHYYPYRVGKSQQKRAAFEQTDLDSDDLLITWNQWQSNHARQRIASAIGELLEHDKLPLKAGERAAALIAFGISKATLYRHTDLWHPEHLWKTPPSDSPQQKALTAPDCVEGVSGAVQPLTLLGGTGCTSPQDKGLKDSDLVKMAATGCTLAQDEGLRDFEQVESAETRFTLTEEVRVESFQLDLNALLTPAGSEDTEPKDLSGLIAAISVQLDLLGWSRELERAYIHQLFGKPNQALLDEDELAVWLQFLSEQPPPIH